MTETLKGRERERETGSIDGKKRKKLMGEMEGLKGGYKERGGGGGSGGGGGVCVVRERGVVWGCVKV